MGNLKIENTAIVSFFRSDLKELNNIILKGVKTFIDKKRKIDQGDSVSLSFIIFVDDDFSIKDSPKFIHNDRFGLIKLSELGNIIPKKLDLPEKLPDEFNEFDSEKILSLSGEKVRILDDYKTPMQYSLDLCLSLLSERIKLISGEINRVLLIGYDIKFFIDNHNLLNEYAERMKGLGIFLDCAVFLPVKKIVKDNILNLPKSLLKIPEKRSGTVEINTTAIEPLRTALLRTGGELGVFFTKDAFLSGMQGFASKKVIEEDAVKILSPEERKKGNIDHMLKIALPLRPPNDSERAYLRRIEEKYIDFRRKFSKARDFDPTSLGLSNGTEICQICMKYISPIGNETFYKTGRYCPNCGRGYHLHCIAQWALNSEEFAEILRCPYCYTLLKVPKPLVNGLKLRKEYSSKESSESRKKVRMILVKDEPAEQFCYYCFEPLSEPSETATNKGVRIYKCSACGAHYHVSCLESMYKEQKICKNCGGRIY